MTHVNLYNRPRKIAPEPKIEIAEPEIILCQKCGVGNRIIEGQKCGVCEGKSNA